MRAAICSGGRTSMSSRSSHGGEVHAGFERGDQGDQGALDGRDPRATRAAELLRGDAGLVQRVRVDQVAERFGLREVDAAGEPRALGEFAGLRQARAVGEAATQDVIQQNGSAVRGDLDQVFSGVGVRRGKERDDGFVKYAPGAGIHIRIHIRVQDVGEACLRVGKWMLQLQQRRGDLERPQTWGTDDADASTRPGRVERAAMVSLPLVLVGVGTALRVAHCAIAAHAQSAAAIFSGLLCGAGAVDESLRGCVGEGADVGRPQGRELGADIAGEIVVQIGPALRGGGGSVCLKLCGEVIERSGREGVLMVGGGEVVLPGPCGVDAGLVRGAE